MSPEERETLERVEQRVDEIHNALFVKRPGEEEALIDTLGKMANNWRSFDRMTRILKWVAVTLGTLALAWENGIQWVKDLIAKLGGP